MNLRNDRGFTLAEVMVATLVTTLVLGGAVMLTSRVQESFKRQIEDSAGEQEGRYALDWVSRLIRGAGNNPFSLPIAEGDLAACPIAAGGTPYLTQRFSATTAAFNTKCSWPELTGTPQLNPTIGCAERMRCAADGERPRSVAPTISV